MAKFKVEGLEIKKLLKIARKQPISFAYNPGKGGKDQYLGLDRRQPPKLLGQEAKNEGEGVKFSFGTAKLEGKVLCLTCSKVLPGMAKVMKKYLRAQKVPLNVQIMDGSGKVLESDISDDIPDDPDMKGDDPKVADMPADQPEKPADRPAEPAKEAEAAIKPTEAPKPETEKSEDQPADDAKKADIKALKQKLAVLKPEILKLPEDPRKKLIAALGLVMGAIKAGKLDAAVAAVENIGRALEKAKNAPPPPPGDRGGPEDTAPGNDDALRARLKQLFADLQDDHASFQMRGDKSLTAKAQQLYDGFGASIQNDLKKAAQIVSTLKKFLEAQLASLPGPSAADKAKKAIADASGQPAPAERYQQSTEIATKYPGASTAARDAMDGFAALLGDQEITPKLLEEAKAGIAQAKTRKDKADERLAQAKAMGDGPNKAEAIRLAQVDVDGLQARIDEAEAFEKAARGKKALGEALTFGPLSGNSKQAFSDDAAKALIEGFARAPDLATVALDAAGNGKYPDAVAKGLTKVLDQRDTGFKADNGDAFVIPGRSEEYAADLLKMGANVGPEFFGRLDDYMASGRQHEVDPMGDLGLRNKTAKAQKRSAVLGGALLTDGHIDLDSEAAKGAIGDLLFSPYSLGSPMPAMNEHVVKTLEFLKDDVNKGVADTILSEMPKPDTKSSQKLVRTALRKGDLAAVSKGDAQTAVMASMMKPLDQGPVGSCFATAPARRLRETKPLEAMDAYATIAGTGKYKPPFGPEVAAVTNLPKNEDPLMRSWEYSLATSMAQAENSSRTERLDKAMSGGAGGLSDKITDLLAEKESSKGGIGGFFGSIKERVSGLFKTGKLEVAIADAFEFTYDPTSAIVSANDGKSSTGRFIMVRKSNSNEIRDKAAFVREIADVAITFAGFDLGSDEADEIRTYVASDAFIDKVTPVRYVDKDNNDIKYLPWEQTSGGQTTAATKTLFGDKMKDKEFIDEKKGIIDMGDRTEELLGNMLETFTGAPEEMIIIKTVGMHGFNALPNDPSLDKLKGKDKDETRENLKTHLLKAGEAMKNSTLDAAKAGYMFDKQIDLERAKADTPALLRMLEQGAKDHRPTGDVSPAELSYSVGRAVKEYIEEKAKGYTNPNAAAFAFKGQALSGIKTDMIRDFGADEFVIADSNWGSAEDHTFFVIAPDPATGEPQLWKKTVPPGKLEKATDDWAKAEWTSIR